MNDIPIKIVDEEGDHALRTKLAPQIAGVTFSLPAPKLSPDERRRRRVAFRNERRLYHRKCDATGASIISLFSPDKPHKVYSKPYWWSDAWDPLAYGRPFDFSRTFFEQFRELLLEVPQIALVTSPDADENNCQYINFAGNSRNCYMTFDSDYNEESIYSNVLKHSKYCVDCSYVRKSELCYQCVDCTECYDLLYSQDCAGCRESYFLSQCVGCSHCAFSSNLVRKEYYLFNTPYSKEEYFKRLSELALSSRAQRASHEKVFAQYLTQYPKRYAHVLLSEDCVGDYLTRCRRAFGSFNCGDCEDIRHCDALYSAKDCMDASSFGETIERVYESGTTGINCYNIYFSSSSALNCSDLFYCYGCRLSQNCFGSISLKRGAYTILNRAYSRDEYEALVPRIIDHMRETGEWGEHFPLALSPFGYNETVAQEYFPLTKQEALSKGAHWSDFESEPPSLVALDEQSIPDASGESLYQYVGKTVKCPASGKLFKYQKQEVAYYISQNIPLPVLHPDIRHEQRILKRNSMKLWLAKCAATGEEVYTSYSPSHHDRIYSERAFAESLDG